MVRPLHWIVLFVLAVTGLDPSAHAQVPGGGGEAFCQVYEVSTTTTDGGVFPVGPASCSLGLAAQGSIGIQPWVLLSARADASQIPAANRWATSVTVDLQYDFTVTGGSLGDLVPVLVHTGMSTQVSPSLDSNNANAAEAALRLYGLSPTGSIISSGPVAHACSMSPGPADCPSSFDGDLNLTLPSGSSERVYLHLIVGASSNAAAVASAWIDPYIFVDPQFAHVGDYSIAVSSGVANALPVAEPSPWVLMLAGLGGIGQAVRRRARSVAALLTLPSLSTSTGM